MTFLKRIESLEKQLANGAINEQSANEQSDQLNARKQHLEESLNNALLRSEQSAAAVQQKQMELELIQNDFTKKQMANDTEVHNYKKTIDDLNATIETLRSQLKETEVELKPDATVAEKPKLLRKISSVEFAENSVEYYNDSDQSDEHELNRLVNNSSPVYSVGKISANDSASNLWQLV